MDIILSIPFRFVHFVYLFVASSIRFLVLYSALAPTLDCFSGEQRPNSRHSIHLVFWEENLQPLDLVGMQCLQRGHVLC
jgi:hypothetical protein